MTLVNNTTDFHQKVPKIAKKPPFLRTISFQKGSVPAKKNPIWRDKTGDEKLKI